MLNRNRRPLLLFFIFSMAAMILLFLSVSEARDTLTLKYDDTYDFSTSGASAFCSSDLSVIAIDPFGTARATGVGKAEVSYILDGQRYHQDIVVEKADLTLILLAGQSNCWGTCGDAATSVKTDPGQSYYTALNTQEDRITSSRMSMSNALTEKGKGAPGIAGSLAKEWNETTGEKVWIINMAHPGSKISSWQPDGNGENYNEAKKAFTLACEKAEKLKSRYTVCRKVYFWLQGESDYLESSDYYLSAFQNVHQAFREELGLEYGGLLIARARNKHTSTRDLALNGPRAFQYSLPAGYEYPLDNVTLVSDISEHWISDIQVDDYFSSRYPDEDAFYQEYGYPRPSTVQEVHPDIHYRQPAYNEMGKDAARNMLKVLNGTTGPPSDIRLIHQNGKNIDDGDTIFVHGTLQVMPVVYPLNSASPSIDILDDTCASIDKHYRIKTLTAHSSTILTITAGNVTRQYTLILD